MKPPFGPINGKTPQISSTAFVAPSADVVGDVVIGDLSSVWFQCVLRGDVMPIRVGSHTNIQDGTVIHGTHNQWGVTIGNRVTIGHKAMLHGCEIGDEAFIGMGAILLDGVKVASRCFVGAGSLLTQGTVTKEGWLYMGSPAKAIRPLKPKELEFLPQSAKNYEMYQEWYKKGPEHG